MENQAYHIQKLLANELDSCKRKQNEYAKGHIKEIQDTYKQEGITIKKQDVKGEQQIQDEKVLLYKPYKVDSLKFKTPKLIFIQDKIENLEKFMKFMQAPIQTTQFYLPHYYKSLQLQGEQDEQYQKEIAVTFFEKKHNADTTRKGFPIEIYIGGLPHEPYFIVLTLQG